MEQSKEQYLQKLEKIQKKMLEIKKELQNSDKTYFIELVGTPKSGKTTLITKIKEISEKLEIPIITRRETAEYNPVGKNQEQYGTWMIMELYKNLCEDMECKHGNIVIYDRGTLDRLPWIQKDLEEGTLKQEEADVYKTLYNSSVSKNYKPIVYNFITSPELSIKRKGKEGKFVNRESIKNFNKHLINSKEFFKQKSSTYREFETDKYQGYLKEFIIDVVYNMTNDLQRQIQFDKEKE